MCTMHKIPGMNLLSKTCRRTRGKMEEKVPDFGVARESPAGYNDE